MKIKVTTPMGVYFSKDMLFKVDSDEYPQVKKLISGACESGAYFSFEHEQGGEVFFPKEMIQKSVFELVY